jgi:hypothetical protein
VAAGGAAEGGGGGVESGEMNEWIDDDVALTQH